MKFQNPQNGMIEETRLEWLWALLFGGLYFASKQAWLHGVLSLVLGILTAGISWLVYPFFAESIVRKAYTQRGWYEITQASPPSESAPEARGTRVLKFVGLVVLALIVWGLGAASRQERKEAIRTAVGKAIAPAEKSEWTVEDKHRLASGFSAREIDYLVFEQDRQEMRDCFAAKFMAALPGGPAEMARVSRDGTRLERISHDAGFACAQEYSARVAAETTWSPRFAPVFVNGCVRDGGESMRAVCACLAEKARRFYGSPPEFLNVMNKAREARTAAEHRKWMNLIAACADRAQ